jgi:DNA-binding MarR family transcriptional regulator
MKLDIAPSLGVKGVHVFWVYELFTHPEGLTATEIANVSRIDRSLVSREIEALKSGGYIASVNKGRRYNERLTLTEEGMVLAEQINTKVVEIQNAVGAGIDDEELRVFYSVLERLHANFDAISERTDNITVN